MMRRGDSFSIAVAAAVALSLAGCSSAKKREPELSELEGRKVALVDVEGETTAKRIVEVALVNQLVKRGSFILINKKEVDKARALADVDPTDWKKVAERAGAELALKAKVLRFEAAEEQGYSKEKVYDSQLAAERGEDQGETERLYKVRSLNGVVAVELEFVDLRSGDVRSAVAESEQKVVADASREAAHLPPKLRFLEGISNVAFDQFFDKYE